MIVAPETIILSSGSQTVSARSVISSTKYNAFVNETGADLQNLKTQLNRIIGTITTGADSNKIWENNTDSDNNHGLDAKSVYWDSLVTGTKESIHTHVEALEATLEALIASSSQADDIAYTPPSGWATYTNVQSVIDKVIVDIGNISVASSQWTDNSGTLYPKDSLGAQNVIIGGIVSASADIILNADGSAIFNEQGADVDFRIEGDTNPNAFFVEGSSDHVGIGTNNPSSHLDVYEPAANQPSGIVVTNAFNTAGLTLLAGGGGSDATFNVDTYVANAGAGGLYLGAASAFSGNMNLQIDSNNLIGLGSKGAVGTTPQGTLDIGDGALYMEERAAPTVAANSGAVYVKDVAGTSTLFFKDNATETNLLDEPFDKSNVAVKAIPTVGFQGGAGLSIGDWLEAAFFPFLPATISFAGDGLQEKGLSSNTVTLNGSVVARDETSFNTFVLKDGGNNVINTFTNPTGPNVTTNWTFNRNVLVNETFTISLGVANNGTPITITAPNALSFYYPTYYHVGATGQNEAQIKAGTKAIKSSLVSSNTYTTSNNYIYIAYPSAYGALTKIHDPVGNIDYISAVDFVATNGTLQSSPTTQSWTTADSTSVTYYVYRWINATTATGIQLDFS